MNDPLEAVFGALADPTRRQVLFAVAIGPEVTATQLSGAMPVTRQAIAKHLQVLAGAGLVVGDRRGRETVFRLTPAPLHQAVGWIEALAQEDDVGDDAGSSPSWQDHVAGLQRHLDERRAERGLGPRPPLQAAASGRRRLPRN